MLDMTLEQGHQVFLKALAGNNFSTESIRAYNADITQFVDFLKSVRVDWNNPQKITRIDIVEFMHRLAGLRRTGTTRARKLASIRHFLKFLKENEIIAGNPAETVIRARKEEKDPTVLFKNEYKALLFEAQGNSRDYAILLTFLKSGIRESELAALEIEDIDFVHDELTVREGKGKKERKIPLMPELKRGVPAVLEQKTTICCKLLCLLTSKQGVSPAYSRERTHVEGVEENPFYELNPTLSVGNIRTLLPRYAWTKAFVFLHSLTVHQQCVVFCTLATGTP